MRQLTSVMLLTVFLFPSGFLQAQEDKASAARERIKQLEKELEVMHKQLKEREEQISKLTAEFAGIKTAHQSQLNSMEKRLVELMRARELKKQAAEKQGARHAYAQAMQAQIAREVLQMKLDLADLQQRLGSEHPQVKALGRIVEAKTQAVKERLHDSEHSHAAQEAVAALAAELQDVRRQYGPGHPRVKSLEGKLAIAKAVIARNDDALRAITAKKGEVLEKLKPLIAELRSTEDKLGAEHPKSKTLREQVVASLKKFQPDEVTAAQSGLRRELDELARVRDAIDQFKGAQSQKIRSHLADAQRELQTKLKMAQDAAQGEIKTLLKQRTNELVEMEERLADAEALRNKAVGSRDRNTQRIEERLSRIESTLKKVIEKLEQR